MRDAYRALRGAVLRRGLPAFTRRFAADQGGVTIIIFALGFSVFGLAAAIAIDYGRVQIERARVQRAIDAAALAAAHRLGMADQDVSGPAAAEAFFRANVPKGTKLAITDMQFDAAAGEVRITSGGRHPTTLMRAFGVNEMALGAGTRVKRGDSTVEVALVLDNSGSMAGTPIAELKDAARNLVDVVFTGAMGNDKVRVGVVPFAASVNVGAHRRDEGWMDTDGLSPVHHENFAEPRSRFQLFDQLGTSWRGCVEARPAPYDVNDAPPSSANPATLFVPMFAPDEPDSGNADGGSYPNNYLNDFGGSCPTPEQVCVNYNTRRQTCDEYGPQPLTPAEAQARMCKYEGASTPSGLGPNFGCTTAPLHELTSYKEDVTAAIDSMVASGLTNIGEGLMWGWRVLSPEAPFTTGRSWSEAKNQKVIVLMTDGQNTYNRYSGNHNWTGYWAFAYGAKGRLGSTNTSSALTGAMNVKTRAACSNAKYQGVIIYTIAFRLENDATTRALLSDCASDGSKSFVASDGAALNQVFQAIGREISNLRVAG
jgi:Flp pilus assembly protein TadG